MMNRQILIHSNHYWADFDIQNEEIELTKLDLAIDFNGGFISDDYKRAYTIVFKSLDSTICRLQNLGVLLPFTPDCDDNLRVVSGDNKL